jgi:hypothetical protein
MASISQLKKKDAEKKANSDQKNLYHALNPEYYGMDNMTVEEKASWKDHTSKSENTPRLVSTLLVGSIDRDHG